MQTNYLQKLLTLPLCRINVFLKTEIFNVYKNCILTQKPLQKPKPIRRERITEGNRWVFSRDCLSVFSPHIIYDCLTNVQMMKKSKQKK